MPTHAGLVFTDGTPFGSISFEAFDQNGISLGLTSTILGDSFFYGETAEDRFLGVTNSGGISRIFITDNGSPNYLEIDHLQYGLLIQTTVPEPSTVLLFGLGLLGVTGVTRKKFIK